MSDHEHDDTDEHGRKPFALALQEMRDGGLHTELSDEVAAMTAEVMRTGKKGRIVLTLSFEPMDDERTLAISDNIVLKTPRFDTAATLYWPDADGYLHRERQDQPRLPLRELDGGKTALDPNTGEVRDLKEIRKP